jgi:hypothetical protein
MAGRTMAYHRHNRPEGSACTVAPRSCASCSRADVTLLRMMLRIRMMLPTCSIVCGSQWESSCLKPRKRVGVSVTDARRWGAERTGAATWTLAMAPADLVAPCSSHSVEDVIGAGGSACRCAFDSKPTSNSTMSDRILVGTSRYPRCWAVLSREPATVPPAHRRRYQALRSAAVRFTDRPGARP